MKKLVEFGKKAMFYVRVLSSYEERRIGSPILHLEERLRSAQEKKEIVNKTPELLKVLEIQKMVGELQNLNKSLQDMKQEKKETENKMPELLKLLEVQKMAGERQNLNKSLQDVEADIKEYYNPIDKEVKSVIDMQMEKTSGDMLEKAERTDKEVTSLLNMLMAKEKIKTEMMGTIYKQAILEKAERDATVEIKNTQNQSKSSSGS